MSNITIQELFQSAKPKLRPVDITWEGQTAKLFFQRLTYEESVDIIQAYANADGGLDKSKLKAYQSANIAKSLRDENGANVITPEEVLQLEAAFFQILDAEAKKQNPTMAAVEDVAKNSEPTQASSSS